MSKGDINMVLLVDEQLQVMSSSGNWREYLSLCKRHNMIPVEYVKYLSDTYNFTLNWLNAVLVFKPNDKFSDFTFLSGVSLPYVEELKTIYYIDHNKDISSIDNYGAFSIKGLNNIDLPSLFRIDLASGKQSLEDMAYLRSNSLRVLSIRGDLQSLPSLDLPILDLILKSSSTIELNILNSSKLENLALLSLVYPNISIKDTDLDWRKFPELQQLTIRSLQYDCMNYMILGKEANTLSCLKHLNIRNCSVSVISPVCLKALRHVWIEVVCLDDILNLTTPKASEIYIYTHTESDLGRSRELLYSLDAPRESYLSIVFIGDSL